MIKFSNRNAVLTWRDIVFTCALQSREVISGVSEARMQWVLKQGYVCSLDTWRQPTRLFFLSLPSFLPSSTGRFPKWGSRTLRGNLKEASGVQKNKGTQWSSFYFHVRSRWLNVMFYGGGAVNSGVPNRCSTKKNLPARVGYPGMLALNSFIRFYRSLASLLHMQPGVMWRSS